MALEDDSLLPDAQEEPVQAPEVNPRERIGRAHGGTPGGGSAMRLPEGYTTDDIEYVDAPQKQRQIGPKGQSVLDRAQRYDSKVVNDGSLPPGYTMADVEYVNPRDIKPANDEGFHIGGPGAFVHGLAAGVPKAAGSVLKGLGELFGGDNMLTGAGKGINEWTDKNVGFTPEEQNTVLGQAGAGLAPIVAAVLAVPALVGVGAVAPEAAVAAGGAAMLGTFGVLGAAGGINEQADKARAAGMEPSAAANITGGLVGGAEGVALGYVGKFLAPFAKASAGATEWLKSVVLTGARDAAAFGGLAVGDQYVQDQIHKQMVDPNAEFHTDFTSAAGQALVGALIGGHNAHKMPFEKPAPPGTGSDSTGTGTPPKGGTGAEEAKRTATPVIEQTSASAGKANEPAPPDISAQAKANIGNNFGEADGGSTGRFKKVRGDDDRSRLGDDFVDPDKMGLQEDAPIQQGGHEPDNFVDPNKMPLGEGAPMQANIDPAILEAVKSGQKEPAPAPEPKPTEPPAPKPTEPPAPAEPPPPHTPDEFVDPNKMGLQEGAPIQGSEPPPMAEAPAPQPTAPPAAEAAKAVSQRRQQLPRLEPKAEQPIPQGKVQEAAPAPVVEAPLAPKAEAVKQVRAKKEAIAPETPKVEEKLAQQQQQVQQQAQENHQLQL